ncbi:MAG: hypothetical protein QOD31_3241 [Pseudonocardiales bacterium]|jgi:hypothetical protein|nr:hypothetical protein [Pseudonocardiales bacterium]
MFIRKWHIMRMVDRDLDELADFLLARTTHPGIDSVDWITSIGIVVAAYREGLAVVQTERAMRFAALPFSDHPDYRAEWAL